MVVGDESALKVHVHTDDPGAALTLGRPGRLEGSRSRTCIARPRSARPLLELVPIDARPRWSRSSRARERAPLPEPGATQVVEGGQSMNPSTADILAAIEATPRRRWSCSRTTRT
jgi:hypothetical protein